MDTKDTDYCRDIESYLCRKNDGHLIRIVGPAFERVCEWAEKGVPLKVAFRGIDRYFERYYAKGPRRRPIRVEHCEADVLDLFDEWRRAVGVTAVRETRAAYGSEADGDFDGHGAADAGGDGEGAESHARRGSLPAHLDRAIARLIALRAGEAGSLDAALDEAIRQLDALRVTAKGLRGEARQAARQRMQGLDDALIDAARSTLSESTLDEIGREADVELAPFRARMPAEAYAGARAACITKIIRDRARLPTLGE